MVISERSTTTEMSPGQTIHWRVTTEPAFVTKHKYPSHLSTLPALNRPDYTDHPTWNDKTWTQSLNDKRPSIDEDNRHVTDNDGITTNKIPDKHRPSQNINHQQKVSFSIALVSLIDYLIIFSE